MRPPIRGRLSSAWLLTLFALSTGCGYSPNPPSMKLICGPMSSCPEGYTCMANTCWKPSDVDLAAKLVGHWVFGAASIQTVACSSDGSTNTSNLAGPDGYLDVKAGTTAALATFYYCNWNLDLAGQSTAIEKGQSCSGSDTKNPDMTYTWHGESLTLTSADGKKGKLSASFPFDFKNSTTTGNCSLQVAADLTKN